MRRGLFWFRHDLRIQDHPLLLLALKSCDELTFVYILNPSQLSLHPQLHIPRMGTFRKLFLFETLRELSLELQKHNHQLHTFTRTPIDLLPQLCERYGITDIFTSAYPAADETEELQQLSNTLAGKTTIHQLAHFSLIEHSPEPLPRIFTDFRTLVERELNQAMIDLPAPLTWPRQISITERSDAFDISSIPNIETKNNNFVYRGGESHALARLEDYVWQQEGLRTYKDTRNHMTGPYFSSRISPWLAMGSLWPRRVLAEIRLFEKSRVANESTYWLKFELLWRDFFYFQAQKWGSQIFQFEGLHARPPDHRRGNFKDQLARFKIWAEGNTGQPLVDAILHELNATGFTSNRGRQIAASFLIYDLGVDWRWGAQYFESLLIDFDPCSNYGNWAYIAGVGSDPRPVRRFDPLRQAELYDPEGEFQSLWAT